MQKLRTINRNQNISSILYWIALKSVLKSKIFWVLLFIVLIVFVLIKSLNLINSIYEGSVEASTSGFAHSTIPKSNVNIEVFMDSWKNYVYKSFEYSLNNRYLIQFGNMQVFYNFIVISFVVITANLTLFKKIKNSSILIYLSTPTTKTRIMFVSFLASLTIIVIIFVFFHSLDTIITYATYRNFEVKNLKTIVDNKYGKLIQYFQKQNTPYGQNIFEDLAKLFLLFQKHNTILLNSNTMASVFKHVLDSKTCGEYLNFLTLSLVSSIIYALIILPIVFMMLLVLNLTKTISILLTFSTLFITIAIILAKIDSNSKEWILMLKWMFFPSLVNDLITSFYMDYAGFHLDSNWVEQSIANPIIVLPQFQDPPLKFWKTSIFENRVDGILWVSRKILYSILPISAILLSLSLPFIYKKVDWK